MEGEETEMNTSYPHRPVCNAVAIAAVVDNGAEDIRLHVLVDLGLPLVDERRGGHQQCRPHRDPRVLSSVRTVHASRVC